MKIINLPVAAATTVKQPSRLDKASPLAHLQKAGKNLLTLIRQFSVSQVVGVLHSNAASSTLVRVGSDPDAALTVIE